MANIDCVASLHAIVSTEAYCFVEKLIYGFWQIFSTVNGNPEIGNFGIRFCLGIFFSIFLMFVLQMRVKILLDKKHLIAFIGVTLLLIRYLVMLIFEWGWQINLYDDWTLHFLYPPLEHFFYMMFFGCMGYYSLNAYGYYPGLLRRILLWIPIIIVSFFIYATIQWKSFFLNALPLVSDYKDCVVDYQSHLLVTISAFYIVCVAIKEYRRYFCFLSAFWTIVLLEHGARTVAFFFNFEPAWLATIFHAMSIWSLPILIMHFVYAYVLRIGIPIERRRKPWEPIPCPDCTQPEDREIVRSKLL
jgi:hypothetical protein